MFTYLNSWQHERVLSLERRIFPFLWVGTQAIRRVQLVFEDSLTPAVCFS